jgi:hypothetical protein
MKKDERTEHEISSGWGDALNFMFPEEFQKPWTKRTKFTVTGHKRRLPKVGDRLKAEFQKSWMVFRFVEVKPCWNPPDMFFGKVVAVEQTMKATTPNETR